MTLRFEVALDVDSDCRDVVGWEERGEGGRIRWARQVGQIVWPG